MHNETLLEVVTLLAVSVLAIALFKRFQFPSVLAYLAVGVLIGPHGLEWVEDSENIRLLAEFGVVFLLFTLGLEFSLPKLIAMRREVLGLGSAQVIITTTLIAIIAWGLGESGGSAFVIGGVFALSSTAIVIKLLGEQLELSSRHGRYAVAILLFQDIAVVPFLIAIPALSQPDQNGIAGEISLAMLKGVIVLIAMMAVGHWLLRPLFREMVRYRSSELFTLTVLLFALAAALATSYSGLSLALGAFIAGMMLGETEFRSQVEVEIKPLRDVLLGLFFITIGMLLNLHTIPAVIHWVVLVLICFMGLKLSVVYILSRLIVDAEQGVSFRTGMVLCQGGEFGFALLALAISDNVISGDAGQIVLAASVISMVLTPTLVRYNGPLAKKLFAETYGASREKVEAEIAEKTQNLSGHVIICGFGRIGQNVARFLEQESIPYTALDLDAEVVRQSRAAGKPVNYGDSTHRELLIAAGLERAKTLLISYDDLNATRKIIQQAREHCPEMPILVRVRDDSNLKTLYNSGATEVVPETLEASLMLASALLRLLDVPAIRIRKQVQEVRAGHYHALHEMFHGEETHDVEEAPVLREGLHCVTITTGAKAVNRRIDQVDWQKSRVKLRALRRGEEVINEPPADIKLQDGDVLVIYGTPENLQHAENLILAGDPVV
ncbi:MAG: monovalent cation:proton antiporter-2 (CPA2) family protein [Gammaproteobacteria bacterium]|nr:monovalent cation:proton antiporter-2 (CPA2) family protein [Gammaproteobacteria bacterium]